MECFGKETFGPVVSIYRFHSEDEAVERANDGHYGLNASIYSRDGARGRALASRIKCGTVNVNEAYGATFGSLGAPMGGMRESGMGRRQGAEGIHRYTETQSIATQRLVPIAPMIGMSEETNAKIMTASPPPAQQARPRMSARRFSTTTSWSSAPGSAARSRALRLTEKGYRVGVLEAGARFEDDDLPDTSSTPKRFLFQPAIGSTASSASTRINDCLILAGAGVGGGSLVYANTLYEPLDAVLRRPAVGHITDWKDELAPYYDQAKRMLGVIEYPYVTPADEVMEKVADRDGRGRHVPPDARSACSSATPGQAAGETVADPFFGGAGPSARTCINCGSCMTGCRTTPRTPW